MKKIQFFIGLFFILFMACSLLKEDIKQSKLVHVLGDKTIGILETEKYLSDNSIVTYDEEWSELNLHYYADKKYLKVDFFKENKEENRLYHYILLKDKMNDGKRYFFVFLIKEEIGTIREEIQLSWQIPI